MRPVEEARAEVLAAMPRLGAEQVGLEHALGRILAEDALAGHDVPPFPNSAMDGFAVISADVAEVPVRLDVLEDVPAGSVATQAVREGTAIKIMTGAPMPSGADAVVKVESTHQPAPDLVEIRESVSAGTAVRPAGGDFPAGTRIVQSGSRLGPVEVSLLATVGVSAPLVSRRPRVAVMSTGDELVAPSTADLAPGMIRDSNRPLMRGLVVEAGADVVDMGVVGDDEVALTSALSAASADADAIVTSGGVSMGDYDLVKQVLAASGEVGFWQVAMQPAKPFAFGHVAGTPLFGLPGNPVSALVAFEQFVRPALLHMQGGRHLLRPQLKVRMGEAVDTDPQKLVFVRVVVTEEDGVSVARLSGGQSSNVLSAVTTADGFAVVPVGVGAVAEGDVVSLELFRHPERRAL
ncbi:molybdopterin molybdotransferase MoeA [soil metagenome]